MVASKDFIDKHPDVVVGWLRAELDAHKMMHEQPDECAKIIAEDWKKFDVPMDVIRRTSIIRSSRMTFPSNGGRCSWIAQRSWLHISLLKRNQIGSIHR